MLGHLKQFLVLQRELHRCEIFLAAQPDARDRLGGKIDRCAHGQLGQGGAAGEQGDEANALLDLASAGIAQLIDAQKAALANRP